MENSDNWLNRPLRSCTWVPSSSERYTKYLGFYLHECWRGQVAWVRSVCAQCENTRDIYKDTLELLRIRDKRLPLEDRYEEDEGLYIHKIRDMDINIAAAQKAIKTWEKDH